MSRIKFGLYQTPANGEAQPLPCARFISQGTKGMEEICDALTESSTLTSADIKGVLEGLSRYIGRQLSYGYNIALDGLGTFSPALRTIQKTNEKGEPMQEVQIHGVNFRCDKRLKERVKRERPQKIKRLNIPQKDREGRRAKMLEYLQTHPSINVTEYARMNHCTHYAAQNDIRQFVSEGIIYASGARTHRVYLIAKTDD